MGGGIEHELIEDVLDLPPSIMTAIQRDGQCLTVGDLMSAWREQDARLWRRVGAKNYSRLSGVMQVLNNSEQA